MEVSGAMPEGGEKYGNQPIGRGTTRRSSHGPQWCTPPRLAADRARPHPRLLPEDKLHGAERDSRICERHGESHDATVGLAEEPRGMIGTASDGIEGDVVEPGHIKPAGRVRDERLLRIPRRTTDVDVCARVGHDGAGVVAAPHTGLDRTWLDRPRAVARHERR